VFRLEVGRRHGVQPGNIVGALAHEGDLHGSEINGIDIRDDHTLVRLPAEIPEHVLQHLSGIIVRGRPLDIRRIEAYKGPGKGPAKGYGKGPGKGAGKGRRRDA
jgi:ATP-dependent RNA helicase DeaD